VGAEKPVSRLHSGHMRTNSGLDVDKMICLEYIKKSELKRHGIFLNEKRGEH
jgi:hypothetical protein